MQIKSGKEGARREAEVGARMRQEGEKKCVRIKANGERR